MTKFGQCGGQLNWAGINNLCDNLSHLSYKTNKAQTKGDQYMNAQILNTESWLVNQKLSAL